MRWTVFVRFISTDDSLRALSSLEKKRKASQGTEDIIEDHAGILIMNKEYYFNDITCEEMFLIM